MTTTSRILYCHCAHAAGVLPEATRAAVLEGLARLDGQVHIVDDLCGLTARRDPSLREFAAAGTAVVACHARAVRWLFEFAGMPLDPGVTLHDMRDQSAEQILSHLAPGDCASGTRAPDAPKPVGTWVPWFPVIDYARCKNCRQCQQFCLFGVYATDGQGRVTVVKPEKCKTNCPACARICPHAAIIFPKFAEGGPISGDDSPPPEKPAAPIDFSSLSGLNFQEALRRRSAIMKQRQTKGSP
jgi:Pyruvate/2-oxoacid:ferredoxin oxidoreductase delta subunit